jgi:hypothetical protein
LIGKGVRANQENEYIFFSKGQQVRKYFISGSFLLPLSQPLVLKNVSGRRIAPNALDHHPSGRRTPTVTDRLAERAVDVSKVSGEQMSEAGKRAWAKLTRKPATASWEEKAMSL